MTAEIEDLFHAVADLTVEARTRYFSERGIDETTRKEVEALVNFDFHASASLERDISRIAESALPRFEPKNVRCGQYLLGECLGSGGMGTVHLGERVDGEVAHRVAVKLLRPGADDPVMRQRFLSERQILATLSHPNIARLLDAGHCEHGQPYLVMEYVEGKTLDVWTTGLGTRHKIKLFLKVCSAVGYLHRNLVVHRDLKPSNILVTNEDEPKLLDFGLAKMLDVSSDFKVTGALMLTPDYASPEQVAGGPVSTATDIYSLGAVLYHLFTGRSPHKFEGNSPAAIASTITTGPIMPPGELVPELRGDLDAILMKTLRKEPHERYATIEQLSEDLENYLDSRPVRARRGDTWYRARKFLRRYRVAVAATAVTTIALFLGSYVANHERAIAEQRFMQVRQFASKLIALEGEIKSLPGATNARKQIVSISIEYLASLGAEVRGDRDLALEIATAYLRVAGIQHYTLGQFPAAEVSLRQGEALVRPILAAAPGDRRALLLSAEIANDRATLAESMHRRDDLLAFSRASVALFDRLLALPGLGPGEIETATRCYHNIAVNLLNEHFYTEAIRCARRAAEISKSIPSVQKDRSMAFGILANCYRQIGDLNGALEAIRESRNLLEAAPDRDKIPYGFFVAVLWREGLILGEDGDVSLNRPADAIAVLQRSLELSEDAAVSDPNDYVSRRRAAAAGRQLANIVRYTDPRRALKLYDQALLRIREAKNNTEARREEAVLLANSSYPLRWLHREAQARERIDAALGLLADAKDYPAETITAASDAATALRALADHYGETGRPEKAAETYAEMLRKTMASNPDADNDLRNATHISRTYTALAPILRRLHRESEAADFDQRRTELWRHWDAKLPNNEFVRRQLEGSTTRLVGLRTIW